MFHEGLSQQVISCGNYDLAQRRGSGLTIIKMSTVKSIVLLQIDSLEGPGGMRMLCLGMAKRYGEERVVVSEQDQRPAPIDNRWNIITRDTVTFASTDSTMLKESLR